MTWSELEKSCSECNKCPLGKTKINSVLGRGNRSARLMFVGEAPGESEDKEGRPFVGKAGQLLDKYLTALDYDEGDYYICNILKCRPPHNRDPEPDEQTACMEYLREQVRLVKPDIIVCLGRIAACAMISPDFKITRDHGKEYKKGNFIMYGVYHPSALLRDYGKREDMHKDLEVIKKRLEGLK